MSDKAATGIHGLGYIKTFPFRPSTIDFNTGGCMWRHQVHESGNADHMAAATGILAAV